jgi:carboxymethylenebutenolidase
LQIADCRLQSAGPIAAGVVLLLLLSSASSPAQPEQRAKGPAGLPPFLDEFRANREPAAVAGEVAIPAATGTLKGYLTRPDTRERLPAVLLLHDEAGPGDWLKERARELCGLGYVVLVPDLAKRLPAAGKSPGPAALLADEPLLAELSAAVRWLRRRSDVLPERLGVAGWSWGADAALALAASTPVQGCVVCDATLAGDDALVGGLRTTPLLLVVAGQDAALPGFRKALEDARVLHRVRVFDGVAAGFMRPRPGKPAAHKETEEAWVEIYNFLGKYVEDAPENGPVFPKAGAAAADRGAPAAGIADLMRAVNQPAGVRGALIRLLEKEPGGLQEWKTVRADAAVVVEAGGLLERLTPPRGTRGHWLEQVHAYTAAARKVVAAADRQDYAGARRGLAELAERCAACHQQHR